MLVSSCCFEDLWKQLHTCSVLLAGKETRKTTSVHEEQRQKLWKTKLEIETMYGPDVG